MWYCRHDRHHWRMLHHKGQFFHNKIPCSSIYNIFDSKRGNASEYHKHFLLSLGPSIRFVFLDLTNKEYKTMAVNHLNNYQSTLQVSITSMKTRVSFHNEFQKLYDTFLFIMFLRMVDYYFQVIIHFCIY